MVAGDGLEEHRYRAIDLSSRDACRQHCRGVIGSRGRSHDETGNVAQHRNRIVVVKMTAESLLVAISRNTDDEAVAVLAIGEERQRRSLAAQLVLGVVEVGEVFDLGNRHEAADRAAIGQSEDRGLVEQGVEHSAASGLGHESLGHAVHTTFHRDVLAEHQHVRLAVEHCGQCGVDGLRKRQGLGVAGRRQRLSQALDLVGAPHRQRTNDFLGRGELLGVGQIACDLVHHVGNFVVPLQQVRLLPARCQQRSGSAQDRVAVSFGAHLGTAAICGFDIGAGVTAEPHGAQMQERGLALVAHPTRHLGWRPRPQRQDRRRPP